MLAQEELQELLAVDVTPGKVCSLYLDTDMAQETRETIKLRAKSLLKQAEAASNGDSAAIEHYLDYAYDWSRPGLAIFSSAEHDFFRAYPSAVPFYDRVRVGAKPYMKPLAYLLQYYTHYGVILVDSLGARFFHYHLGELKETESFLGEEVRKLKHGGGSSATGMRGGAAGERREEEAHQRNLREATAAAATFFSAHNIRRLFIGGTADNVSRFRDYLPKQLQSCLAGTFAIDMGANDAEVTARVFDLMEGTQRAYEQKMVEELITTASKGGKAAIGLEETLQAVREGRVQTLVISEGFRAAGYFHREAGFLTTSLVYSPFAEEELDKVEDIVETAVEQSIQRGGQWEVVRGNVALDGVGHIGAFVRF